jgi:hypothetical protein
MLNNYYNLNNFLGINNIDINFHNHMDFILNDVINSLNIKMEAIKVRLDSIINTGIIVDLANNITFSHNQDNVLVNFKKLEDIINAEKAKYVNFMEKNKEDFKIIENLEKIRDLMNSIRYIPYSINILYEFIVKNGLDKLI